MVPGGRLGPGHGTAQSGGVYAARSGGAWARWYTVVWPVCARYRATSAASSTTASAVILPSHSEHVQRVNSPHMLEEFSPFHWVRRGRHVVRVRMRALAVRGFWNHQLPVLGAAREYSKILPRWMPLRWNQAAQPRQQLRWSKPRPPLRARNKKCKRRGACLKATMSSWPQHAQCTRMKPCSGIPHFRNARKVLSMKAGSAPCSRAARRNPSRWSRTTRTKRASRAGESPTRRCTRWMRG